MSVRIDYNRDVKNKPRINGVEVISSKNGNDYKLANHMIIASSGIISSPLHGNIYTFETTPESIEIQFGARYSDSDTFEIMFTASRSGTVAMPGIYLYGDEVDNKQNPHYFSVTAGSNYSIGVGIYRGIKCAVVTEIEKHGDNV